MKQFKNNSVFLKAKLHPGVFTWENYKLKKMQYRDSSSVASPEWEEYFLINH
jgi:hypothetical protein